MHGTTDVKKKKTFFIFENVAVYGKWENIAERSRPQMTIWRMRIACWIPKATNTHSEYVILIAFPLQQSLYERASMLRCTYVACPAIFIIFSSTPNFWKWRHSRSILQRNFVWICSHPQRQVRYISRPAHYVALRLFAFVRETSNAALHKFQICSCAPKFLRNLLPLSLI
jgi:hypothetical protein